MRSLIALDSRRSGQAQLRDRRATTARGSAGLPATTLANTRGARRSRACQTMQPVAPASTASRRPGSRSDPTHTTMRSAGAPSPRARRAASARRRAAAARAGTRQRATPRPARRRRSRDRRSRRGSRPAEGQSCAHARTPASALARSTCTPRVASRRQPLRRPRGCPTMRQPANKSAMRSIILFGGTGARVLRGRGSRAFSRSR